MYYFIIPFSASYFQIHNILSISLAIVILKILNRKCYCYVTISLCRLLCHRLEYTGILRKIVDIHNSFLMVEWPSSIVSSIETKFWENYCKNIHD